MGEPPADELELAPELDFELEQEDEQAADEMADEVELEGDTLQGGVRWLLEAEPELLARCELEVGPLQGLSEETAAAAAESVWCCEWPLLSGRCE